MINKKGHIVDWAWECRLENVLQLLVRLHTTQYELSIICRYWLWIVGRRKQKVETVNIPTNQPRETDKQKTNLLIVRQQKVLRFIFDSRSYLYPRFPFYASGFSVFVSLFTGFYVCSLYSVRFYNITCDVLLSFCLLCSSFYLIIFEVFLVKLPKCLIWLMVA